MSSLIQELKRDGTLILYHDYRSGSFNDFSGNGYNGSPTNIELMAGGYAHPTALAGYIDITYDSSLLLPQGGSIVVLCHKALAQTLTDQGDCLIRTGTAAGDNYRMQISAVIGGGHLYLYNGADNVRTTTSVINATGYPFNQTYGATFAPGTVPSLYINGVSDAAIGGAFGDPLYAAGDACRIANSRTAGLPSEGVQAVLVTSTQLTATQQAQIYGELMR